MTVYRVTLMWNEKLVFSGAGTCVVSSDIVSDYMGGGFAGRDHVEWCKRELSGLLDKLLSGVSRVSFDYSDDTGHAVAIIERMF